MSNFGVNYAKILETIQKVEDKMNFLNQICKSKPSNIELIAIDSEWKFQTKLQKKLSAIFID